MVKNKGRFKKDNVPWNKGMKTKKVKITFADMFWHCQKIGALFVAMSMFILFMYKFLLAYLRLYTLGYILAFFSLVIYALIIQTWQKKKRLR